MNINLPSHPHSLCHTEKKKENYCRALDYNKTLTCAKIILLQSMLKVKSTKQCKKRVTQYPLSELAESELSWKQSQQNIEMWNLHNTYDDDSLQVFRQRCHNMVRLEHILTNATFMELQCYTTPSNIHQNRTAVKLAS